MGGWWEDPGDLHRPQLHRFLLSQTDDSQAQQLAAGTGYAGHRIDEVVRLQHYGLSSVPPMGGEGLLLSQGGRADRGWILGQEHPQYRPVNTPVGGTVLYDNNGNACSIVQKNIRVVHASDIQVVVGSMLVRVRPGRIDLGAMEAPNQVMTSAGLSSKVYAVT